MSEKQDVEFEVENNEEDFQEIEGNESEEFEEADTDLEEEFDEEEAARKLGWNPDGPVDSGKENLSAREFLGRKPLFDKIRKQSRDIKELKQAVDAMRKHDQLARKAQLEELERNIRSERRQAIRDEDHDLIDELDEKIYKTRQEVSEIDADIDNTPEEGEEDIGVDKEAWASAYEVFLKDNAWYQNNKAMNAAANSISSEFIAENGGLELVDPVEVMNHVAKEMREQFPEKFGKKKMASNTVEGGQRRGVSSKQTQRKNSKSWRDLPEEVKEVGKKLVRAGAYESQEAYAKDFWENQ